MTEKEKTQRIRNLIVTSAVVFGLCLIIALIYNIAALVSANARAKKLEAQLSALNQEISVAATNLEYYKTPEYIEQYAREYLEMKKTDEIAFIAK